MAFPSASTLSKLFVIASLSQDVLGFASVRSTPAWCILRPAFYPKTVMFESSPGSDTSASEKAAELKRKAEEAKRKAEELKKIAEAKAAAAMMAVKKSNDQKSNGAESTAKEVIETEPEKVSTKADAVKESKSKASSRVIPDDAAIIPINEDTIEFTAGILGAFLAISLGGGPVLAVVSAAATNYISKKDDFGELNELVQSISKASLGTLNWFAKLNAKYTILGNISKSLDESINKLKESGGESGTTIKKIEDTVNQTTKQLKQLADETDFFAGSKQALGAVGEIIESGVDKAVDANKEYKLTERAASAAKIAIEKAKKSSES